MFLFLHIFCTCFSSSEFIYANISRLNRLLSYLVPWAMAHLDRSWLETQLRYWGPIPAGSDACRFGCAYTVVCSAVYDIVHYTELLKSFNKSRAQSRLLASFCRDIAMSVQKATQSSSRSPWDGITHWSGRLGLKSLKHLFKRG